MPVVKCHKCGTKNQVPDTSVPGKIYRCGKCKTRLTVETTFDDGHGIKGAAQKVDRAERMPRAEIEGIRSKPSSLNSLLTWFQEKDYRIIVSIALLALALHLFIIPYAKAPIFDEGVYIPEAKAILNGGTVHLDQFALGKLLIASGIKIFGDNPWGWRLPSTVFAVASIIIFYLVCRKLAGKATAFFSVFVLTFESLIFNYSSLAMVEVFIFAFMLLSFLFYLKDRYVLSGISLALSGLVKLTGLLGILVILGHWLIVKRAKSPKNVALLMISAFALFFLLMPILDFAETRQWLNPFDRVLFVLQYHEAKSTWASLHGNFLATESPPWKWVFSPTGFHWSYPYFNSLISTTVWIMIIPSIGYTAYEFLRKRSSFSLFVLLWFGVFFFFWMSIALIMQRVTYHYYVYPSLLAVCAAIGFALSEFWRKASHSKYRLWIRGAILCYLGIHLLVFLDVTMVSSALRYYL